MAIQDCDHVYKLSRNQIVDRLRETFRQRSVETSVLFMNAAGRLQFLDVFSQVFQKILIQINRLFTVEHGTVNEIITRLIPELDVHSVALCNHTDTDATRAHRFQQDTNGESNIAQELCEFSVSQVRLQTLSNKINGNVDESCWSINYQNKASKKASIGQLMRKCDPHCNIEERIGLARLLILRLGWTTSIAA